MLLILREGPAVGMRAVVTTDRTALIGQVGTVFQRRLVLNLADPDDASYAGLNVRAMPAHQPPGRLVFLGGTQMLEAQVALLDEDPAGTAQVAAIHSLAARARERYDRPSRAQRPLRVDALPPRTTITESLALDPSFSRPSPLWALIGSGGDELGPQGIDIGTEATATCSGSGCRAVPVLDRWDAACSSAPAPPRRSRWPCRSDPGPEVP